MDSGRSAFFAMVFGCLSVWNPSIIQVAFVMLAVIVPNYRCFTNSKFLTNAWNPIIRNLRIHIDDCFPFV